MLNAQQQNALHTVVHERRNLLITGSAGTGKSTLIEAIYKELRPHRTVAVTSMTGVSAILIKGRTLHSYLGIGLGRGSPVQLANKIQQSSFFRKRWRALEVLIVDEISMMSASLFDTLEEVARILRRNRTPFGGIQLVLSCDFLQLPMVGQDVQFCFEAQSWDACVDTVCYLTEIFRQSDRTFIEALAKVRLGQVDESTKQLFNARDIPYDSEQGVLPTTLFATNAKVDTYNQRYYNQLPSKNEHTYTMKMDWKSGVRYKEKYEKLMTMPVELKLKVGAQVMHLVNTPDHALVNGSRGVVAGFNKDGYPHVRFANGIVRDITPVPVSLEEDDSVVVVCTQLPLRLAWCSTIHKAQGCTLDLVLIDFKHIFEYAQFYVALSRARTLDGLYVRNINWDTVRAHPKALAYYKSLE